MADTPKNDSPKIRTPARAKRVRRIVFAVVSLVLVALVGISLIPEPTPVDLVEARRDDLRVTVQEDGTTRVKDRYVVAAPLGGSLARIELHAGDVLREGDVIARVLPSSAPLLDARTRTELAARLSAASAGVRQAEAGLARARTASTLATREVERSRALAAQGSMPSQQLERIESEAQARREEVTSAEFGVRIARHQLAMAQAATGDRVTEGAESAPFEVRSPITGRVLRVLQSSGGPVAPGTPLVEIGDSSALEIVVDVLTSDAVRIRPGSRVEIDRWGGAGKLAARVRLVEPSAFTRISALGVEEQRVNVIIDLVDPYERWSSLGDGYRVEASIVVDEVSRALLVPELAVFRTGDTPAVYEVDEGVARIRRLRIGRRNGIDVEVLSGLSDDAVLILHPSERVTDGVKVEAR